MKRVIIACTLVLIIAGGVKAQVSKSDFTAQVNILGTCVQTGNISSQVNGVKNLDGLMGKQIDWLQSDIKKKQTSCDADKAKLEQLDITVSKNSNSLPLKEERASEQKKIDWLKAEIDNENKKLGVEQAMHKEFQSLTGDMAKQSKNNKDKAIADLNQFASTLN